MIRRARSVFLSMEADVNKFVRDIAKDAPKVTHTSCRDTWADGADGARHVPAQGEGRRAFEGETCQVEAIPPDVLMRIVRDAIDSRIASQRGTCATTAH
jgi:hypothetical protein